MLATISMLYMTDPSLLTKLLFIPHSIQSHLYLKVIFSFLFISPNTWLHNLQFTDTIYRHNYLQQIIQNIVLIFYCFIEFLPDIKMLQTLSYERFKNNYMTDSFRGNIRKTINFCQPSHAKIVEQCLKLYSTLSIVLFSTIVKSQLLCLPLPWNHCQ